MEATEHWIKDVGETLIVAIKGAAATVVISRRSAAKHAAIRAEVTADKALRTDSHHGGGMAVLVIRRGADTFELTASYPLAAKGEGGPSDVHCEIVYRGPWTMLWKPIEGRNTPPPPPTPKTPTGAAPDE